MVAIVSGNNLGLNLGSLSALGAAGQFGKAALGQAGERAYVDVSTGNLVLQDVDTSLVSVGNTAVSVRTYNSQGRFADHDNGDGWMGAPYKTVTQRGQQPVVRTDVDGSTNSFVWDPLRNAYVAQTGASQALDTIVQDAAGRWVFTDGTTGRVETYQGNGQGLILTATDRSGNQLTYSYDAANHLSAVASSTGETVNYTYVGNQLMQVSTTLQGGQVVQQVDYTYDLLNRLETVSVTLNQSGDVPAGAESGAVYTTRYTYLGLTTQVASVAQSDGTLLSFTYVRDRGTFRVASVTNGVGEVTQFHYDLPAGTTTVIDPLGVATVYSHDARGQLTQVRFGVTPARPAGLSQVAYEYDARGNVLTVTDALGHAVHFTYDGRGNQSEQVDALGNRVSRTFDARNQVLTETLFPQQGPVLTTRYVYDTEGGNLLRFTISAQGSVSEFRYDGAGLRTSAVTYAGALYALTGLATDAAPSEGQMEAWAAGQDRTQIQRTDFGYDFRGQLKTSTTYAAVDAAGEGVTATASQTHFVYDQKGELLQTITPDGAGITRLVYDGLGRVVASSQHSADGTLDVATLTQYDDAGGKVTLTNGQGLSTVSVYDLAGRLVSVSQNAGGPSLGANRYVYDAAGNVAFTEDATGARSWTLYDAAGRKVAEIAADGQLVEYVYDAASRLTQTIGYAQKVDPAALVDGAGVPLTQWNANPAAAPAGTTPVTLAMLRQPSAADQRSWNFYDADNRVVFQVDALGHVTQTQYDGASRVTSVTRLARAIDTAALGNGTGLQVLLGGYTTSTTLTETIQGGGTAGPNAPRILTAQVSGSAAPGGLVSFYAGNTLLGTATLSGGTATLVVSNLPPGDAVLVAVYAGDAGNLGSTSAVVIDHVLPAYPASVTLATSTASAPAGAVVTLTATVTGQQPTGMVIFYRGSQAIGIATLVDGSASIALNNLPLGSNQLTAVYQGDADNALGTSAIVTEVITQATSATSESVTTLLASSAMTLPGQPVVLTAQVSGAMPSGTMSFFSGTQLLGQAVLVDGLATLTVSSLPVGARQLTARYAGDTRNTASTSAAVALTVLRPTTTSVAASAASSPLGAPLLLTATIAGAAASGVVTFYRDGVRLGSATVSAGRGTLSVASLPLGSSSITASYSGDGANIASVSGATTVTVVPASTTTTLTVPAAIVASGVPLTLTARVEGTGAPAGTVTFFDLFTVLGTATVVDGVATLTVSGLPTGTARLRALYGGDTGNTASTSNLVNETVTAADVTQTALSAVPASQTVGSPVTFTATLSGAGTMGGTVTFFNGATALGTAVVAGGQASLTLSSLPVGTVNITATYGGDAAHSASSAPALAFTVLAAATTTSLASSAPVNSHGNPFTLTASVAGGLAPTGVVTFLAGSTVLGTATLVNGQASLTVASLPAGTATLQASYSGDSRNVTSLASLTQTTTPASTTTSLGAEPATAAQGTAVILTAQVASPQAQATGVVTFYNGTQVLGTANVTNGLAALTVSNLPPGANLLSARYAGDANTAASTSAAIVETIAAAPQPTSTTLVSSRQNASQGTAFTLTATVAGAAPSGRVTFLNGLVVLGTATVNANGVATLVTNIRTTGNFSLVATYAGDAANASSVSGAVAMRITNGTLPPAPPVPPATTTTLTSSAASALRGDPVTLTAQVNRSTAGAAPTGTVSFFNGTVLLGSASVAGGAASLTLTNLPVGAASIRAVYSGDPASATSTSGTVTENIALAPSSVSLSRSASTLVQGASVLLTAQVSGNVAPGGTVTFFNGATALGTVAVANGLASLNVANLPVGTASLRVRYNGDANNAVSNSATSSLVVTAAPAGSSVTLATSARTVQAGQPLTLTATVRGTNPTGTVSFFDGATLLGSARVANGQASLTLTTLPAGRSNLRAVYSGDAANLGATSGVTGETVNQAPTTTTLAASTTTSVYGNAVVLTANVAGTGSPDGTVNFYSGNILLGAVALTNGQATLTVDTLPVGTDTLTAAYLGDASNTASTSAIVRAAVASAPATLSILSPAAIAPNGDLSIGVTGVSPLGSVVFLAGTTVLGVAALVNGVATLHGTGLVPGSHALTALYSGDGRNASGEIAFTQDVVVAQTTTTLTTDTTQVAQNAPVRLTARVTGSKPGGTVTFHDGTTVLGTASVVNGLAALTVDSLDAGVASLSAAYSGDANNTASVSAAVTEDVQAAAVNVTLASSAGSVQQGAPLTLTATVTGNQPGGTVAFVSGTTTLGSATLLDGRATLALPALTLPAGAQQIVAIYMGDGSNAPTLSAALVQNVTAGIATLLAAQDATDRTVTLIADADGRVRASIDAEGYLTEMRYDAAGRSAGTVRYANRVPGFTNAASIAARVQVARETGSLAGLLPGASADDIQTFCYYNARGQKVGEVDGERFLTEYVYDSDGNLAQQIRYATAVTAALPGNLAAIRPAGSAQDAVIASTWDALNRLATQTNAEGTVTSYGYDAVGRVVTTTVALNTADQRTMTVRYDVQGRVVAELSPEGAALLDGSQTAAQVEDIWAQYGTKHAYDAMGRRTSSTDANGHRTVFLYDDAGRLRYSVNALGEVQERRYGALGRLEQTVSYGVRLAASALAGLEGGLLSSDAAQPTAQALAALSSADQSVDTFHYDADGRLVETLDALAGRTTLAYNAFHEVTQTTQLVDGSNRISTQAYDRRGLAIQSSAFLGSLPVTTTSSYDAFGRLVSSVDPNGNLRQQSFDRLGRVIQTIDPTNAVRTTRYDAFSRVLTQTDALGHTTSYTHDRATRSVTMTTAEGVSVRTVHNRTGETQQVTDGNGHTTSYSYDRNGNLLRTATELTTTSSSYDHANRLIRSVDANGVAVEYVYDAANRILSRTLDPDGLALTNSYTYDAKGQQVTATDANGVVTATRYDLNGRVLTQTVDPQGLNLTTSYEYNSAGDVLTVRSPGGTVTRYGYDSLGRRTQEELDPAGLALVTRFAYDAAGNMVRRTDARGASTAYVYDANDRLVFTVDAAGGVRETRYDAEGRVVGTVCHATPVDVLALPVPPSAADVRARVVSSASDLREDLVLDRDGRLQFSVDGAGDVTQYFHDGNGNTVRQIGYALPVDRASWIPGTAPAVVASAADHEVRTAYDALNRVQWVCDGGELTQFLRDANGNITRQVRYATRVDVRAWDAAAPSAPLDPAHDATSTTVYDAANRAIFMVDGAGGLVAQQYDGNGNVVDRIAYAAAVPAGTALTAQGLAVAAQGMAQPVHDAHVRRVFDAANRLVWSVDGTGAATQQVFDANGNLVKMVAYATPLAASAAPDSAVPSAADRITVMAYDAANQKTWQVDALGGATRFIHDAVGHVVARTEYATRVAAPPASADAAWIASQVQSLPASPHDRTSRVVFDAANRQLYAVDAAGDVSRTLYDGCGRITGTVQYARPVNAAALPLAPNAGDVEAQLQVDAADRQSVRAYDAAGRQQYAVDSLGYVTESRYDGLGQLTRTTLYVNSITSGLASPDLALAGRGDAIGILLQPNLGLDRRQSFSYDAAGHLATATDALNHAESFGYDGLGNRTSFTNKNGATWTYQYDAAGRLLAEISPLVPLGEGRTPTAIVTRMAYDALGNLRARTEAAGIAGQERTTSYEYDAVGRQVKTTFPPVSVYDPAADNLAVNGANGLAARTEGPAQAFWTEVTYDAFGDAIANRDVSGHYSYKAYDKLGWVTHEIDALGQVNSYGRSAFSEATSFTRHAATVALPAGAGAEQVAAALAGLSASGARTLQTEYDTLGRAVRVTEPTVWVHPGPDQAGRYDARVTRNVYNAFGELAQTGVQVDAQTFAATTHFHDLRGQEVATLDPAGYLTTQAYDAAGNLLRRTEFANSFAGLPIDALNSSANDRTTTYTYDTLNRKVTETRLNVQHSDDGLAVTTAPLTTTYFYDAVGNLQLTIDPLNHLTHSEYDALGRVTRVLAPGRQVDGVFLRPVTDFFRDAHGNVLLMRQYGAGSAATRDTRSSFDSHGNAILTVDAENVAHFMSYDAQGHLVKEWQAVQGIAGDTHTLYTAYRYDAIGQQVEVITPGSNSRLLGTTITQIDQAAAGVVRQRAVYNAFGEVVQRGTFSDDAVQLDERFDYDDAGHLIRTNSGDGNYKFFLYNVQGFQVAQIAGAGGADGADLSLVTSAQAADGLTVGVRRTDARVDILGRALEQRLPARSGLMAGELFWLPLQPVLYQTFDRWGNIVSQSDPRDSGLVTFFRYDANNQVVEQVQPGGITTRIRYDGLGRQTGFVDANGNLNRQQWDGGGNLVGELHADGGAVRYDYSIFGERSRLVDAEGKVTTYMRDRMGRVTDVITGPVVIATVNGNFSLNTTFGSLVTHNIYDAAGRKIATANGAGEYTLFTHDLRGNVVATQQPLGQISRATFDIQGRQTGAQDAIGGLATWTYDYFGQLRGHRDLGGIGFEYTYDSARQLVRVTSGRGQDISYGYDAAGQLLRIDDATTQQGTRYSYDAAGHRRQEVTIQRGVVYQSNLLSYDALGRLSDVQALDGFHIHMDYDAVGNKIHQRIDGHGLARAIPGSGLVQVGVDENNAPIYAQVESSTVVYDATAQDLWFAYDSMNRQILVDGVHNNTDLSANNINAAQGHILTYDRNGNRMTDTFWGTQVVGQQVEVFDESSSQLIVQFAPRAGVETEFYSYDQMNRLLSVATDTLYDTNLTPIQRVTLDTRYYDGAGRMVQNGPGGSLPPAYAQALSDAPDANGAFTRTNSYDANGRLQAQHVLKADGSFDHDLIYAGTITSTIQVEGIDENGNPYTFPQTVTQTGPGYDAAGNIIGWRLTDKDGVVSAFNNTLVAYEGYKEATVSGFRSDNAGQVRTTTNHYDENGFLVSITDDTGSDQAVRHFVNDVNGMILQKTQQGRVLKQLVVDGKLFASYGMAQDETDPSKYVQQAEFDTNYQPITNSYPSAGAGAYTVRTGDTLMTIAQAAYGDAQLWYVIADANALTGDRDLRVGQTLIVPAQVGSVHNTAGTYKPYDPSRIIGSTSPQLPVPQNDDDDCGGFGAIIMIIVTVVVAIFAPELLPGLFEVLGATEGFALAAVSAAIGNIAGQLVGNALGVVDGFSWKQVALAAVSAGIGEGIGAFLPETGNVYANLAVKAAVSNALVQGVSVATGLQDHFSWRAVASSAVAAGVGGAVGDAVGPAFGNSQFGRIATMFVSRAAGSFAAKAAVGGQVSDRQILTDAFGNALGTSLGYQGLAAMQEERLAAVQFEQQAAADQQALAYAMERDAREVAPSGFSGQGLQPGGGSGLRATGGMGLQAGGLRAGQDESDAPRYGQDEQVGDAAPSAGASTPNAGPTTVRAGDFGGSLERIARAQLGPYATQREINNYVGQLFEINGITNARQIRADRDIVLPQSDTPAASSGLQQYGKDIAIGEQIKADRYAAQVREALAAQAAHLGRNDAALRESINQQFAAGIGAVQANAGAASGPGGHWESQPTYDMANGAPNGGSEQVWVSDRPMSYGDQMRNVGKFLTDTPIGVVQQIVDNPGEAGSNALRGTVGLVKGVPNAIAEVATQTLIGVRYLAAATGELTGLASPGALDREIAQYRDFSGRLFEYGSTAEASAGFVSGFATPSFAVKGFTAANDLYSLTRTATIASRDWSYAAMEREMLAGAGAPRGAFAEMSIPSFGELNYMAEKTLDFSTRMNGAVFWSDKYNMQIAQTYGNLTGRTTLEQTTGGRYLDSLELFSVDGRAAAAVFDRASVRFAEGASGDTNAFLFGAQRFGPHGERTWWRVEQPALQRNSNVTNIREWKLPWD